MKRVATCGLFILLGCLPAGYFARAGCVEIGYSNCLAVADYSQPLMNEIAQLKLYFAHASVGGNMMNGIADLRSLNSSFYQLRGVSAAAAPAGVTPAGVICDYSRGNPGWQAKVDGFQACVSNGWRFPQVNLVLNKFCYIDQAADLGYYLHSMTNLEAAFPETVFVYMTIPLMTSEDNNNYLRDVFNDGLRDWVRVHNRVLYDIADIEAHDTNGVPCTFTWNERLCEKMYAGWSSDGGHLNTPGRQLVARGFYALAMALLAADRDGDGLSDGRELIAGTCPADDRSVFRLSAEATAGAGDCELRWNSVSNRYYTLQRAPEVSAATGFSNLLFDIPAVPPVNAWTDAPPGETFFYRVRVRQ